MSLRTLPASALILSPLKTAGFLLAVITLAIVITGCSPAEPKKNEIGKQASPASSSLSSSQLLSDSSSSAPCHPLPEEFIPKDVPHADLVEIDIFFHESDSHLSKVRRPIEKTPAVANAAVRAYLAGPACTWYSSEDLPYAGLALHFLGVTMQGKEAVVRFDAGARTYLIDDYYLSDRFRDAMRKTLLQFPSIQSVSFSVGGVAVQENLHPMSQIESVVEKKFPEWMAGWKAMDPSFTLSAMSTGGSGFHSPQEISSFTDIDLSALENWVKVKGDPTVSPDGTKRLYAGNSGEPDSCFGYLDKIKKEDVLLLCLGTMTFYIDAAWIDNDTFIVVGADERADHGNCKYVPTLNVIDPSKMAWTKYTHASGASCDVFRRSGRNLYKNLSDSMF